MSNGWYNYNLSTLSREFILLFSILSQLINVAMLFCKDKIQHFSRLKSFMLTLPQDERERWGGGIYTLCTLDDLVWQKIYCISSSLDFKVFMMLYISTIGRLYGTDWVLSLEVCGITENTCTHTYSTHQDAVSLIESRAVHFRKVSEDLVTSGLFIDFQEKVLPSTGL